MGSILVRVHESFDKQSFSRGFGVSGFRWFGSTWATEKKALGEVRYG
jgi:hypothetical protein